MMKKLTLTLLLLGSATHIVVGDTPHGDNAPVAYSSAAFKQILEKTQAQLWDDVHRDYREKKFRYIPDDTFSNIVKQYCSSDSVKETLSNLQSDEKKTDAGQSNYRDEVIMTPRQMNEIVQQPRQVLYAKLHETDELYRLEKARNSQEHAKENNRTQSGWRIIRWWHGR
jgi:hypothetical protein